MTAPTVAELETALGVSLMPWQRFLLERALGPEADGMAATFILSGKRGGADTMRRVVEEFIAQQEAGKRRARRRAHMYDTMLVLLGIVLGSGVTLGLGLLGLWVSSWR